MKILIIHGSPRRGNTWSVLNKVKEKISNKLEVEYDLIELSKFKLESCKGCFNCILKGEEKCPHYKDMLYITDKIKECNGIIITSPVYSLQISGVLKNFLDHMSYNFHRPRYFTKRALIITTTAGVAEKKISDYISKVLRFWGINKINSISIKYREDYLKKYENKINKEVNSFIISLESEENVIVTYKNIVNYNAFKAMSMTISDKNSADYRYWIESGMYKMPYAENVQIGRIKTIFSNVLYNILYKSMSSKDR